MKSHTHACIAYIVGRLISGKNISAIYDYASSQYIDIDSLPDAERLKEFDYLKWAYMSGSPDISRFKYSFTSGHFIDISIKGNTFIGYIHESSSHFMGNVRGNSIFIYDHKKTAHFNFRISGSALEDKGRLKNTKKMRSA